MSHKLESRSWHRGKLWVAAVALCPALVAGATFGGARNPLRITADATRVTVHAGDRPLLQYRYAEVPYKPYVERFPSPGGVSILRDSPHDHKHHHALMFAVAVDGINFWEEQEASGRQAHRALTDVRIDAQNGLHRAGFTEHIDWVSPRDDKVVLQEQRMIEVYQGTDLEASLMTWRGRFTLPAGKASAAITGSRYFGLGVRFVQSMDTGGAFVNANGKTGVDGTNEARSAWCAYTAQADGKRVTVAMFDHPVNIRHPATWFTMETPFAYLAGTLELAKQPLTVAPGKPLELRYGVAVWDGTAGPSQIEKLYRRWVGLPAAGTSPAREPTG